MAPQGPSIKELILDEIRQALGDKAIETVQPTAPVGAPKGNSTLDTAPTCLTQKATPLAIKGGPADIMVGLFSECPRWVPGSTIRWAAWRQGFDSQEDADYAATHLQMAAEAWNSANVGIKFEWVPLAKDATFVLCHGGPLMGVLASAFFPNKDDLNFLNVYTAAFESPYKESMWRIFAHELGHVLGLRHEFAMDILPGSKEPREGGAEKLGDANEKSVMNYRKDALPEIQASDVYFTKQFYQLKADANGKPPKVGLTEVKDYYPM